MSEQRVPDQPKQGSCWWIANKHQMGARGWNPTPPWAHHPMACKDAKANRREPTLLAVPRTTKDPVGPLDAWTLPSLAGCTPKLDKAGWFLFRFSQRVLTTAFGGFTGSVFRGQLTGKHLEAFQEYAKLKLPPP